MASPQVENGYTAIANEVMDALVGIRIPGEAYQVLMLILRKTYGWKKKKDEISLSQFVLETGMKRASVVRSIKILSDMNLIIIEKDFKVIPIHKKGSSKNDTTVVAKKLLHGTTTYCFNKNYESWRHHKRVVAKMLQGSSKNDKKVVAKMLHTKTNTKTNISMSKKTFLSDSDEIRLGEFFIRKIRENLPDAKQPNLQSWASDFDLIIRRDKRTAREIAEMIEWVQKDEFWWRNIMSPKKLRDKWDQLSAKRNGSKRSSFESFTADYTQENLERILS